MYIHFHVVEDTGPNLFGYVSFTETLARASLKTNLPGSQINRNEAGIIYTFVRLTYRCVRQVQDVKALVRWATSTGKKVYQSPTSTKPYNTLPPWNGPDIRVNVSPTRGSNFWGSRSSFQILDTRKFTFV